MSPSSTAGRFGYDLNRIVDGIRPAYSFDFSCQGKVPEAIIAFLDATSFEDAIRNALSLGGRQRYTYLHYGYYRRGILRAGSRQVQRAAGDDLLTSKPS
jgi:hypothetical protein